MADSSTAPDPTRSPEHTDADRDLLRDRIKGALERAGTTARATEEALDLPRGTLGRIYTGKRQLDAGLAHRLATRLGISASELLSGTSWAAWSDPRVELPRSLDLPEDGTEARGDDPEVEARPDGMEAHPEDVEGHPEDVEGHPEEVEARVDGPRPAESPSPAPPPREPSAAEEPEPPGRRLSVPVRAAIAIAGGLGLIGATVVALLRRR